LDRLARDAYFLLGLQKSGVDFTAVDLPAANRFTIALLAVVAEEEGRAISARTKAALAAAKARGQVLGNPGNLTRAGVKRGVLASARARSAKAMNRAQDLAPTIAQIQRQGARSLRGIATELNAMNYPAPRNGAWSAVQVQRVIRRLNA